MVGFIGRILTHVWAVFLPPSVPASLMLAYCCTRVYCRPTVVPVDDCCGLAGLINASLAPEQRFPFSRYIHLLLTCCACFSHADLLLYTCLLSTYCRVRVYCLPTAVSVFATAYWLLSCCAPSSDASIYCLYTVPSSLMLIYCCVRAYCRSTADLLLCACLLSCLLSCGLSGFIDGILAPELLCPLFRNGGASCVAVATERYF